MREDYRNQLYVEGLKLLHIAVTIVIFYYVAADTAMEFNELRELKSMNQLFVDMAANRQIRNTDTGFRTE